jgi:RimJ/RimL family protein N-acetyltransferase
MAAERAPSTIRTRPVGYRDGTMSPVAEVLATPRLDLVPLRPEDADEMVQVLADARLYEFTGGRPPNRDELRERYVRQAAGRSPGGDEEWHNWIVRRRPEGEAIGFVQATIVDAGRSADIAWLVGVQWQGRGFAAEAARALVDWLELAGVSMITAHVHPDHRASAAVAASGGLEPTDRIDDGERVWQARLAGVTRGG